MQFNEGQQTALDVILDGQNVFLTGQAGVGKSEILKEVVHRYNEMGKKVGLTAMTGVAGSNLNGVTLHRWAGIGLGDGTPAEILKRVSKKPKAVANWKNSSLLIVDEISMLNPELFEKLDFLGRGIRRINAPFGGLQLLFCGDFCQLPPVKIDVYCFECATWEKCNFKVVHLTQNMRQNDPIFQKILSEVRMGFISQEGKEVLRSRVDAQVGTDEIRPTVLFSTRNSVDKFNSDKLKEIATENNPTHEFMAGDFITTTLNLNPDYEKQYYEFLDKSCQARKKLHLKVGAQVMLIHNLDIESGLINGSRGVVTEFKEFGLGVSRPVVKFLNGIEIVLQQMTWDVEISDDIVVSRSQIPLILAFGGTIHKCQGLTLDCVTLDLGDSVFAPGQFYTALSRVRDLKNASISALNFDKIVCDPRVRAFYDNLK